MIIGGEGIGIGLIDTTVILESGSYKAPHLQQEAIDISKSFAIENEQVIRPYLEQRVLSSEEYRSHTSWYRFGERRRLKNRAAYWDGVLSRLDHLDQATPRNLANYLGAFYQSQVEQGVGNSDEIPLTFSFDNVEEIVVFFKKRVQHFHTRAQKGLEGALDIYPDLVDIGMLMDYIEAGTPPPFDSPEFREIEARGKYQEYAFNLDRYDFVDRSIDSNRYRGYVRDILMLPLAANVPEPQPILIGMHEG